MTLELEEGNASNPLLNHLVIRNVLKYVHSIPDLKKLRLLCHEWEGQVMPLLMGKSMAYINSGRQIQHYSYIFSGCPRHFNFHVKILQSLTQSEDAQAFISYLLKSPQTLELHLSKCVMKSNDVSKILRNAKTLKTLSFNEVIFDKDTPSEIDSFVEDAKNLTRLEVTTCDEGEEFPWVQVLSSTPNLEILHAQLQSSDQVTGLLESLLDLERKLPLKEFSSFLVDLDLIQLNLLGCLNFPFKVLDLSIDATVTCLEIQEFLTTPSLQNLESLKLFHEVEEVNKICIPKMPFLKSLELMGDAVSASILDNVNKSCSFLKHLNLCQISDSENEILKMKFVNQSLISISVEEGFLPHKVLLKLGDLFPQMRRVSLFLNDDNISALFKNFQNLEEIMVLGTELTDLGIIGVTPKGRSCISDCKKLRKFSLYPQPQHKITDMTVIHGLIHVKELTNVELPETAVTNEGLRSLLKAKPNLIRLSAKIAINPRTGEHSLRCTKYQIL